LTEQILSGVAIPAESLESDRESFLSEPLIEIGPTGQLPVRVATAVDVVNGQKDRISLAAAGACFAIMIKNFFFQLSRITAAARNTCCALAIGVVTFLADCTRNGSTYTRSSPANTASTFLETFLVGVRH
jgi:hypothetical protein